MQLSPNKIEPFLRNSNYNERRELKSKYKINNLLNILIVFRSFNVSIRLFKITKNLIL